jgi:YggT family protein
VVSILGLINIILDLFSFIIIASAILSWLVAFNIVNTRNQAVATIGDVLWRMTEPVLRPIRNIVPSLGGIDVSPIIVLLGIWLLKDLNSRYLIPWALSRGL